MVRRYEQGRCTIPSKNLKVFSDELRTLAVCRKTSRKALPENRGFLTNEPDRTVDSDRDGRLNCSASGGGQTVGSVLTKSPPVPPNSRPFRRRAVARARFLRVDLVHTAPRADSATDMSVASLRP